MTGFGRGTAKGDGLRYVVEVRSLNNRYCEVSVHAPRGFLGVEHRLAARLRKRFARGKFNLILKVEPLSAGAALPLDERQVVGRWKSLDRIRRKLGLKEPPGLEAALCGRGEENGEVLRESDAGEKFLRAAERAFAALAGLRRKEGKALVRDIRARAGKIAAAVGRIEAAAESGREVRLERLRQRVTELMEGHVPDRARLETELALLVEKADVTEEIVRLKSHVERLTRFLEEKGAVGRNLDFLVQEIFREINTIGAKAADPGMMDEVLAVKAEAEKIREQAQNLE